MSEDNRFMLEHKNRLLAAQNDYLVAEISLLKSSEKIKSELIQKYMDEISTLKKELEGVI